MSGLAALSAALLLVIPPVSGQAGSFDELLERARIAEFFGKQVVVCWAPGGPVADTYRVGQAEGRLWMALGSEEVIVADGELLDHGPDRQWRRTKVAAVVSTVERAARYRQERVRTETRFGRPVEVIEVKEGTLVRARFVFDRLTSVSLMTEIFDGDGSIYRMSALVEFTPGPPAVTEPAGGIRTEVAPAAPPPSLGSEAVGYRRAGVYEGPGSGIHAYYSDGLFSFSVFEVPGPIDAAKFDEAPEMELAGAVYLVRFLPSEVWVLWSGGGSSYLLIGDLPPDHLEAVLAELPRPDPPGLLTRLWRMLRGR